MSTATSSRRQIDSTLSGSALWTAAGLGALVAVVVNLIIYYVGRGLFAIPFLVLQPGSNTPAPLNPIMIVVTCVIPAIGAAIFFWLLKRFASSPLRIFQIVSIVLALLSMASPLTMPVALSTRLALALMHIVAGAAIVGAFTWMARR
jgi:hypothetical protein